MLSKVKVPSSAILADLPAAWSTEHLLVLMLAGLHVDVLLEGVEVE